MKKKYFLFFLLSLKILAQTPQLDNTFNVKETGIYQQNIGHSAVVLPNNQILSVFGTYPYNVMLLNPDGSPDKTFNTTDSYTTRKIRIFPKFDGSFITLDEDGKLKAFKADGTIISGSSIPSIKNFTSLPIDIKDIIYQDDGKTIIYGSFHEVNNIFTGGIVRLNADGSVDETFKLQSGGNKLIIQSDGKYFVTGRNSISRYLADGKIDPTFKVIATIDPVQKFVSNGFETANNSSIKDITVQPDGKIIAVGCDFVENSRTISYNIVRLNSNGSRDTGFKPAISQGTRIQKVYLQKDNKIILNIDDSTFIRLNTDGTIDNTFKYSNTTSLINKGALFFQGEKMIISDDFKDSQGITRSEIHRINNNGSIDLTFNPHTGPNLFFDEWDYSGRYEFVSKVLLDQKILLIGDFTTYNDNVVRNICRINQNGEYDPTFKLDPTVKIYAENQNLDNNYTILPQNNGKILLKSNRGVYVNDVLRNLIRLNYDGSLDKSFNFYDPESSIRKILLLENGKILLLGGGGTLSNLTRLNSDGSIDSSFNCVFYHTALEITLLADKKFLITFSKNNDKYTFDLQIKFNEDGSKDTSFKSGFSYLNNMYDVKELSNGKLIAILNDQLTRLNADGSIDKSFTPYSVVKTSSNKYDRLNYYENGNIFLFFSTNSTGSTTKLTLSSEGKLLNTVVYKSNSAFEIQNCEDLLFYGYFNKIQDVYKSGLARYKTSNTISTPNPEGEIYQSFENGQTLKDLKVNGADLKWYNIQTDCGINNKITKKGSNFSETFLPPNTVLVDGMTYYASQSINGIESSYRLPVTVYYSTTLGVKDNNAFPNLITYPNPVKDFYTISNSEEISKVEVYNISGQLQFSNSYNNSHIKIDFTSFSSGLYFVKIFSAGKTATIKTIKN